jgi:hypothetical protein
MLSIGIVPTHHAMKLTPTFFAYAPPIQLPVHILGLAIYKECAPPLTVLPGCWGQGLALLFISPTRPPNEYAETDCPCLSPHSTPGRQPMQPNLRIAATEQQIHGIPG